MTTCPWCEKDMKEAKTCYANLSVEFPDGTAMPSLTEHFNEPDGHCHDCNIVHGGHHHPGCDVERCPRCGGQLIGCGCLDPEEEDEEDGPC